MKKISLLQLKPGKKSRVVEIIGGKTLENRLMGMGIYLGRDISKVGHFVLRGPVAIKAGRTTIALGHDMAKRIIVEDDK